VSILGKYISRTAFPSTLCSALQHICTQLFNVYNKLAVLTIGITGKYRDNHRKKLADTCNGRCATTNFSKSRDRDTISEESSLIFRDTQIVSTAMEDKMTIGWLISWG